MENENDNLKSYKCIKSILSYNVIDNSFEFFGVKLNGDHFIERLRTIADEIKGSTD